MTTGMSARPRGSATRQASLVGTEAGFLAVFRFEELASLRKSGDDGKMDIAKKLNHQVRT